jgi:mRNA interferase MazF
MNRTIKRGDIFYYDFGENKGSIQCGRRPVLCLQADDFNRKAPTVIVAAITTVIKKQYMPSHVLLPPDAGFPSRPWFYWNRSEQSKDRSGGLSRCVEDETTGGYQQGPKKEFGLWIYKPDRTGDIRCLCPKCLQDYKSNSSLIIKRLDPFSSKKDRCVKCDGLGYDYIVYDKRRAL